MNIDLSNRCAVVTGGASNIGRGITLALADAGARVVIVDRDVTHATKTAQLRRGLIEVFETDLTDLDALPAQVARLRSAHGEVDILVNNAGWVNTTAFLGKSLNEMALELDLNLVAPLILVHEIVPGMVGRGWGRVISVASEAGRAGQRGQVAYSAAKGGLLGMTRSLSREIGRDGVTVNAVSPAMVVPSSADEIGAGSMQQVRDRPPDVMAKVLKSYPVGRVGEPRDVAAAVTFLASEQAGFITGQTLPVNGGFVTT